MLATIMENGIETMIQVAGSGHEAPECDNEGQYQTLQG